MQLGLHQNVAPAPPAVSHPKRWLPTFGFLEASEILYRYPKVAKSDKTKATEQQQYPLISSMLYQRLALGQPTGPWVLGERVGFDPPDDFEA